MGARKEAAKRGERTYETGRACLNGHITYRYVQSGSCSACVADAAKQHRTVAADPRPELPLVQLTVRAHDADIASVVDTAIALVQMRYPTAARWQVIKHESGSRPIGGMKLYDLNLDERDVAVVRQMAKALFERRCADGNAVRGQIFGKAVTSVPVTNLGSLYEDELSLMHRC